MVVQDQYKTFFEFIHMTHALRKVERMCHYQGSDRCENDMEHGYQLALLCWLVMDKMHLNLSKEKVLKYALAHDLIEVYAGDTNPFDLGAVMGKDDRELQSLEKLEKQFGSDTDMFVTIHEYHEKQSDEAKFVYALDKIIVEYNIFLADGVTYRQYNIDREALVKHMRKAYIYEPLRQMTDDLIVELYRHDERFDID